MQGRRARIGLATLAAGIGLAGAAPAAEQGGLLERFHHHTTLTSTVPGNGDQNPYAIVVSPASFGRIHADDVLVTNFNDRNNLQGLGTTIVAWSPTTRQLTTFATIPRHLEGCPGGIGLTTAMAVLKSGWVVVGSLPSTDGTTATKGQGCLVVLDGQGAVAGTISNPGINGPWGNMAVVDRSGPQGGTATLFVSNAGFGVTAPGQDIVKQATVVRLGLQMAPGKPPVVTSQTEVASGLSEQADKDVFIIGPTGLALGQDGVLYVSDALANRVVAIPDALTRTDSAGQGREVTRDGLLRRPLAMDMAPNGHLIIANGTNGQAVEVDPVAGKQIYAQWIDADKAQQPPGSGDLFGLAMTRAGDGFYYVEDDMNTLVLAH